MDGPPFFSDQLCLTFWRLSSYLVKLTGKGNSNGWHVIREAVFMLG